MIWLNNKEVRFTKFPNGETKMDEKCINQCVKIDLGGNPVQDLKFKFAEDGDLIKLMFVKKYLDTLKFDVNLFMYYMPYSRMDRIDTQAQNAFTLKYVAQFINSLGFSFVTVIEPHSDITPALLDNCNEFYPSIRLLSKVVNEVCFDRYQDYIYYPDVSAEKRYSKKINSTYKSLVGMKKRDFATGEITGLNVIGGDNLSGSKIIMVDDLCSKGGTFYHGAKKLKEMGADEIYVVVGHCEDSVYDGDLIKSGLVNKIYTTTSILTRQENDLLDVTKISELYY